LIDSDSGTVIEVPIDVDSEIRAPLIGTGRGNDVIVYLGDKNGVVWAIDVDRWRVIWDFATKE